MVSCKGAREVGEMDQDGGWNTLKQFSPILGGRSLMQNVDVDEVSVVS